NRSKNLSPKPYKESSMYDFIKERLRVMTASEFDELTIYYASQNQSNTSEAAFLYGRALQHYQNNNFAESLETIKMIDTDAETKVLVELLKAQNLNRIDPTQGYDFIKQLL